MLRIQRRSVSLEDEVGSWAAVPIRRRVACAFVTILVAGLLAGSGLPASAAGGGGDGGSTGFAKGHTTPGQQAISEYRTGEKRLEHAAELRGEAVEARASGNEKKAIKLEKKAAGMITRSERYFRKAIKYDESLFQAWSSLGYTLRRQGRFADALEAYDRAIALEPRYAEAVEYRAETYLELGRLDDAQAGYVQLASWVRPMADRLMVKMDDWVVAKRADPGDLEPAQVEAFAAWVVERKAQDGEYSPVSAADRASW